LFVKNATNSYGLVLSSGYNDGGVENLQTFPYMGLFSEADNTISPILRFNTISNQPVFATRLFKSTYTPPEDCLDDEILTKT
jgi:hypothetical protein